MTVFRETRLIAKLLPAIAVLALLALGWLVYQSSLSGPFLLDDAAILSPLSTVESFTWDDLRYAVFSGRFDGISRSLSRLSLALTQFLAGDDASRFKLENLLLHLANGLLVCWLAALLFRGVRSVATPSACGQPAHSYSASHTVEWWPAILAGGLWLLHPLHISTVAYVIQRLVVLSAFFSLIAAVCYVKGRFLMQSRPRAGLSLMLLGLAVFWPLGLLSKENAALLAPALIAVEWFVFRFRAPAGLALWSLWAVVAVFLIFPIALALLYFSVSHDQLFSGYLGRNFDLYERLLTEIHVLWLYLKLILVPIPGEMGIFHDGFPVQRTLDSSTLMRLLGLLALVLTALALRRRAPLVGLGIVWFFIWHAMESTALPLELVFEHRNYLALFGPSLAVTALLARIYDEASLRRVAIGGAGALILLLALNTSSRAHTWGDPDRLAANEYRQHPDSPRAAQLLMERALVNDRRDLLVPLLADLQRRADDVVWPLLLQLRLHCTGDDLPEALVQHILKRVDTSVVRPGDVAQLRVLSASVRQGNCPAVPLAAVVDLAAALAKNPRFHTPSTHLGALNLYTVLAAEFGDFDGARSAMQKAVGIATQMSPGWMKATIVSAADAAAYHSNYDDAISFIKDVTRGEEKRLYANDIVVQLNLKRPSRRTHGPPAGIEGAEPSTQSAAIGITPTPALAPRADESNTRPAENSQ